MTDTTFETERVDGTNEQERRQDEIARRAYEISLTSESGSDVDNWLSAEQELDADRGEQL
jgi:hypothetical protein